MNEDDRYSASQRTETPNLDLYKHKKFGLPRSNDCKIIYSSDPDPKLLIKKEEIPENLDIKKEHPSEIPTATNGEINGRDVERVRQDYSKMRIDPHTPPNFPKPGAAAHAAASAVWRPPGILGNGEEPPINQQSPTERKSAFKRHGSSPALENGRPPPPPGLPRLSLGSDVELTPVPNSRPHPHLVALPHHPQPHIPPFAATLPLHFHRLQQPAFPNLAHPLNYLQQHAALQLHLHHERRHQIVSSWSSKWLANYLKSTYGECTGCIPFSENLEVHLLTK